MDDLIIVSSSMTLSSILAGIEALRPVVKKSQSGKKDGDFHDKLASKKDIK